MTNTDTLYFLWTTGETITARNMVFMYASNSLHLKWWENVHMLVWGAASELLATDLDIQEDMQTFLELGGQVSVCLRCLEKINRVVEIREMEKYGKLKVYYVGEFFTSLLKQGVPLVCV
ncbi:MAG: hypothetical protein LUE17_07130 [Planctomycetaceae bacterium]|nr:hypothetical protein [Planctomycetaceae bacterium]